MLLTYRISTTSIGSITYGARVRDLKRAVAATSHFRSLDPSRSSQTNTNQTGGAARDRRTWRRSRWRSWRRPQRTRAAKHSRSARSPPRARWRRRGTSSPSVRFARTSTLFVGCGAVCNEGIAAATDRVVSLCMRVFASRVIRTTSAGRPTSGTAVPVRLASQF